MNPITAKSYFDESTRKMDSTTKMILAKAVKKLGAGNFGNCEPLKNNYGPCKCMFEAKVDWRDGYRIYFSKNDATKGITIASAGIKKSQKKDVVKARSQLQGKVVK